VVSASSLLTRFSCLPVPFIINIYPLHNRLFQNIALGEWMDAMEHDGVARSTVSFRTYMLSVGVVLLATMFRAVTQVTSNLISAQVSQLLVCYA